MKKTLFKMNFSRSGVAAFLAIVSVPVTAYALYDSHAELYNYASIGSNAVYGSYSSYSYAGLLFVGNYNAVSTGGAQIKNAMAVGSYNIIYDSDSAIIGKWNKNTLGDELLVLGNGVSGAPSNALEVFKNGNMNVQGAITCAPGGDIPMYGE
jgi:hypothetical protein